MKNLVKRGLTGAVFVAVMVGGVLGGPHPFSVLFLVIVFASANELLNLTLEKDGFHFRKLLALILCLLPSIFLCLHYNNAIDFGPMTALSAILMGVILLFISELFSKSAVPFRNLAYCCLTLVYVGFFLSLCFYLAFRSGDYEPYLMLGILLLTWSSDTFAYLVGSAIGKTPLFKRISPGKTIEGSLGGLLLTVAMGYLLSTFFTSVPLMDWLIIALIVCVIGTLGDLIESMLKRSLKIKDSGTMLPGHGGFLDRFDSFILIIPALCVYFIFKYGF